MAPKIKPIDQYPITETFAADDDAAFVNLARVYRLLEDWTLTHPKFPLMIKAPQTTEKGRGDQ